MTRNALAKSLSQRIAERAKAKVASKKGKNRASFLAVRDEVRLSIEDGWTIKEIWECLSAEGKVQFGYDAFIGYVNRLILHPVSLPPALPTLPGQAPRASTRATPPPPLAGATSPASQPSVAMAGFNFNPTPDKEDLM